VSRIEAALTARTRLKFWAGPGPNCGVMVSFICVRPSHLEAAPSEAFGFFVTHHGTYGYCPGQPDGHHLWVDAGGVTLNEPLHNNGSCGTATSGFLALGPQPGAV
jgi:hypothetical protein